MKWFTMNFSNLEKSLPHGPPPEIKSWNFQQSFDGKEKLTKKISLLILRARLVLVSNSLKNEEDAYLKFL